MAAEEKFCPFLMAGTGKLEASRCQGPKCQAFLDNGQCAFVALTPLEELRRILKDVRDKIEDLTRSLGSGS